MRNLLFIAILAAFISCKNEAEKKDETITQKTEETSTAESFQSFGAKITSENALTTAQAIEAYQNLKPGDTLNLKFEAKVNEVCAKKGCWMKLNLGENESMVRFKDYGFFMPLDLADGGETEVIVEGRAYVSEMSVDEQRHYAEDAGKNEDEINAITEVKRTLSFEADGVLVKL